MNPFNEHNIYTYQKKETFAESLFTGLLMIATIAVVTGIFVAAMSYAERNI